MQNKKPFPGKKRQKRKHPELKAREAFGQRQPCVWSPRAQRRWEILQFVLLFARIGRLKPSTDTDCAFVSGTRARAEQENPTKRTVFSSYRQNGWSKAALKPRPALPFLEIVAGFKLVSCRWLPFLAQVLLYPHKLSLIHPQQDQVLPLPDSNPTSFSSYPLLVSASYTRSVLPPLSFTGQTVCVCVCVRRSMRATGRGVQTECKRETEREREEEGAGIEWYSFTLWPDWDDVSC